MQHEHIDGTWAHEPLKTAVTVTIIPDGCFDAIISRNADGALRTLVFKATRCRVDASIDAGISMMGVRFKPWLGAPLLATPVHDLLFDDDLPSLLHRVTERLLDAHRWLPEQRLVRDAYRSMTTWSAAGLARSIGASERTLRRAFTLVTGFGPKTALRTERMQRALSLLETTPPGDVAALLDFTDQAHLTHELKALTGRTPAQLRGRELQDAPIR